ncbi:MobV family relaxase [Bacillus cereus group sp. BfR-BA-02675]|uniref:MobV family relaxase n=1 Tax=unclassified Bacillus cereus group TaxID=2750818 RepID=UPI0029C14F87|nr:MobV family relaxase [Bacillus cereus group sp. BfR-BA-02675]MDX5769682.1 MobV family relaxase [Bacillus cereus group sp. BfR-BA-02675]
MKYLIASMRKKIKFANMNEIPKECAYDLVNKEPVNHESRIMEIINEQRDSLLTIRKDAVLVSQWYVSVSNDYFEVIEFDKIKEFFQYVVDFFEGRYGKQNIAYAQVHFDGDTPYMLVGIVPMKDGRLQAKNIFDRKELVYIQNELPWFLQKKGIDLERGTTTIAKDIRTKEEVEEVRQLTREMAQEIEQMKKEKQSLQQEYNFVKNQLEWAKDYLKNETNPGIKYIKKVETDKGVTYQISEVELLRLNSIRKGANVLINTNEALEKENQKLLLEIKKLKENQ